MAGRGGRGRGRSNMTFNVENLGIGRGEALPPTSLQPSPLFPPMTGQTVPLQTGEEVDYMLALKQELRAATKNLPFFIREAAPRKDVVRYSDKYHSTESRDSTLEWNPDWSRLPKELCIKVRKSQRKVAPQLKGAKKSIIKKEDILTKLETLEKKEEATNSEDEENEEKKNTNNEEGQEEEEELNEEDLEEDTDYIMSYFDNGEDFGVDSDDNIDEATY